MAARAACCSTPAPATSPSTPTPSAASTDNYRVPSYPYLVAPDPAELPFATQPGGFNGRQPNSWTRSNEQSVGGSYLFLGGFAGIAYTRHNNLYAIPGADGEGHGTRIDARQDKVTGKGEYRPSASGIDAIRFWWGYTDYKHNEIGFADAADPATDGIRQTFTNKDLEGRVEVQLMPFNLRFAELTTAIGVQGGHQRLTAPSPDDSRQPDQRPVRSEQELARRGLHLQRVQVQQHDQGADRRPHRAGESERHDA